jgi:hypothetical protein
MTVFTWTPKYHDPDSLPKDEFQTQWYCIDPACIICDRPLKRGQRVLAWQDVRTFHAHADCIKANAVGLLKDIGECLR